MNSKRKPITSFVLSLLSGIFIIFGGSVWCLWVGSSWDMGWMDQIMHGWDEHMHEWDLGEFTYPMAIAGIVLGVAIIISAVMFYKDPSQNMLWGPLIIVFSVLSVVACMGGMGIGLILGVIGGVLAILWKPQRIKQT